MSSADATAVILAGGKSTRLGRDKASEPLLGVSLLQRAVAAVEPLAGEVVIVRAAGQALPQLHCEATVSVVEDTYPEAGPLGGLYTGLVASSAEHAIVVACDMPLLQPVLLAGLLRLARGHDAVVPVTEAGLPEPLCAVYGRGCIEPIRRRLEAGVLKVASFFEDVRVLYVTPEQWRRFDPDGLSFLNVNRESDLQEALKLLSCA